MQITTNKNIFFFNKGARQGFDLAPTYLYDRESGLRSSFLGYCEGRTSTKYIFNVCLQ